MTENEERLVPYFCPKCEETIFVLLSEETFSKVYKCLTCRSKHLVRMGAVFFGSMRVRDLPPERPKKPPVKKPKKPTKEQRKVKEDFKLLYGREGNEKELRQFNPHWKYQKVERKLWGGLRK